MTKRGRKKLLSPPLILLFVSVLAWACWTFFYLLRAPPLELHHSHGGVPVLRRALHPTSSARWRERGGAPGAPPDAAPLRAPARLADAAAATSLSTPALPPDEPPPPLASSLANTALVTLVGGDISARQALALFQSIRDVGTRIPRVIAILARMGHGSDACHSHEWKQKNNRSGVDCSGNGTIAEEIVSPVFLDLFRRLGVEVRVVDAIPRTEFTRNIPGKLDSFWGYSLNRLVAFNWTEFRKIVYIDTDTLVLRNIDALVDAPHFSAATTYSCCNSRALPHISGGLWVFEPSVALGRYFWDLMVHGQPEQWPNGTLNAAAPLATWHESDMALSTYAFSDWHYSGYSGYWPKVADRRHGYVPGLRWLPAYAAMNDSEFGRATQDYHTGKPLREGFLPELHDPAKPGGRVGLGLPGVVWHALDLRYDQCIGNVCECSSIVGRDMPEKFRSVHFACLQYGSKPAAYASEYEFVAFAYKYAKGCTRHYFRLWLDALHRTGYSWPGRQWDGPPLPEYNATHDALVDFWRTRDGIKPLIG